MTTRRATVIGVFSNADEARAAADELRRDGFGDERIGLIARTADAGTATRAAGHDHERDRTGLPADPTHSQWGEGAGIGAAAGVVTGAGLGLAVAAGLIPGIGPVIVGGTLAALLASAGTGAAVGTVLGALVGLGVPEEEATYYDNEVRTGRTVLTVRADDRAAEAWDVLARHGAYDFENRGRDAAGDTAMNPAPGTGLEATPY
jgi:hypothetical protein